MKATINRTLEVLYLEKKGCEVSASDIAEAYGFKHVDVLDIENHQEIKWDGIEFNRLYAKYGELWRFDKWYSKYPFSGIILERIGTIEEGQQ